MPEATTESFSLSYPAVIRFGWGVRKQLGDLLAERRARRALFVTRRGLVLSDWLDLEQSPWTGDVAGHVEGIPHDPPLRAVQGVIEKARDAHADFVVAIGGGSVIDAAKAAAALAPAEGTVHEYYRGEKRVPGPGLPFAALPTTAGAGAEVTKNAVLSDPDSRQKKSLRSPHMVPSAALVDPEFTVSMPKDLTAASGLDALTQAIESYLSLGANAVSMPLAREACRLLFEWLPRAYADGTNRPAREGVAKGSLLSALAFSQSGLGAVHGLAHPIGDLLDLPHGLTCAILLPNVLDWNRPACQEALANLAATCLGSARATPDDFAGEVRRLVRSLGIPAGFAGYGLTRTHLAFILDRCRSGSMKANPRPMSDEDVEGLLTPLLG